MFAFVVIELLKAQGVAVEFAEEGLDARFHIAKRCQARGRGPGLLPFLLQKPGNTTLQGLKTLTAPGIQQMPAAFDTLLAFQRCRGTAQLKQGLAESHALQLIRLKQGRQPGEQGALLHHQLIAQQPRQIKIGEV